MAERYSSSKQRSRRNWAPFIIGLVAVLIVVAVIVVLARNRSDSSAAVNPYVTKLRFVNPKMSAAQNYVGGSVTYFDVSITNTGDMALAGASMKLTFQNSMGQVVQTETVPLHVLVQNQMGGYPDLVDLSRAPIGQGLTRTVRVTVEHISADWDKNYPAMQLVDLKLK